MGKTIRNTHISGEAGVIKFSEYCNKHKPYIIFREVLKSDFGIDGEVELTKTNEENKIEPTGEIIKVQIKTVNSDYSYIKNERDDQFEFHPRKEDLEYWTKYKNNGIEVVLVIYDQRNEKLYCKKVIDTDIYIAQENLKPKRRKNLTAILFDKTENLLITGSSDFTLKFSVNFRHRVSYDIKESILTNLLQIKYHPKQLYCYKSRYTSKKRIFEIVDSNEVPYFITYGGLIFTFIELGSEYKLFKETILEQGQYQYISYKEIIASQTYRNHYIELLNEHLKAFLWSKKMAFSKDYKRYFFRKFPDENETVVSVTTRKRGQHSEKSVVKWFEYGKITFFRHVAAEFNYLFDEEEIYLVLKPKYLFTSDGKQTLNPKIITKLTNYLTSREYNNHFCDWLHFWWSYLSKGNDSITVYEHPMLKAIDNSRPKNYSKFPRIILSYFNEFEIAFGIPIDQKKTKKASTQIQEKENLNLLF